MTCDKIGFGLMPLQKLANHVTSYQTPPKVAIHMILGRIGTAILSSLCQDFALRVEGGASKGEGNGHVVASSQALLFALRLLKQPYAKKTGSHMTVTSSTHLISFNMVPIDMTTLQFLLHTSWALNLFQIV